MAGYGHSPNPLGKESFVQRRLVNVDHNGHLHLNLTRFDSRQAFEMTYDKSFSLKTQDVDRLMEELEEESEEIKSINLVNWNDSVGYPTRREICAYTEWPLEVLEAIGKLPSLKSLRFTMSKLDETDLRALFAGLNERQSVTCIQIRSSVAFYSRKTYKLLIELLTQHSNLEKLQLGPSPPISRRREEKHLAIPIKALGQAIPSWQNLKFLELSDVRNTKALAAVGRGLERIQSLQTLRLPNYRSGRTETQGFVSLMQSISRLSNLQCLDFNSSCMNGIDACAVAAAVRESKSLSHLNLKQTFTVDNWRQGHYPATLFSDIFQSTSLKSVAMNGSHFPSEGLEAMESALEQNLSLENVELELCTAGHGTRSPAEFYVDSFEIEDTYDRGRPADLIEYHTALNRTGRKRMRDETSTVEEMVESLIKATSRLDGVQISYHLIRETPNKRALFEAAIAACDDSSRKEIAYSLSTERSKRKRQCASFRPKSAPAVCATKANASSDSAKNASPARNEDNPPPKRKRRVAAKSVLPAFPPAKRPTATYDRESPRRRRKVAAKSIIHGNNPAGGWSGYQAVTAESPRRRRKVVAKSIIHGNHAAGGWSGYQTVTASKSTKSLTSSAEEWPRSSFNIEGTANRVLGQLKSTASGDSSEESEIFYDCYEEENEWKLDD